MIMSADVLEATRMLEVLRVTELRSLLSRMGRNKSGLKKDLMKKVLDLLQNECTPELLSTVQELHKHRQNHKSSKPNPITQSKSESQTAVSADDQQMIKLPFHQTLETILPPTPLVSVLGGPLQNSDFLFHLSESQQALIQNAQFSDVGIIKGYTIQVTVKHVCDIDHVMDLNLFIERIDSVFHPFSRGSSSAPSVQVVLRMGYSESIGVEEDQYPANIAVSVNHTDCPVQVSYSSNKPGTEPSRPCRPIDITPFLYVSFTNRFSVTWRNFQKHYSVAVYLVRLVSSQQLLSQLRSTAVESLELCRQRVCEKLNSDQENEITTTGLQVSLICPLAKMRMSVACRARGCAHLQCFDASFYLQMNEKKPRWTCPVCHKHTPFDALCIDGLLCEVLQCSGEDVEEIEYLSDSSWRPVRQDKSGKESVLHPPKYKRNSCLVDSSVVDLTQGSSDDDDDDSLKEEMVSTHLEDKRVHFRKSGMINTSRSKSRSTTIN